MAGNGEAAQTGQENFSQNVDQFKQALAQTERDFTSLRRVLADVGAVDQATARQIELANRVAETHRQFSALGKVMRGDVRESFRQAIQTGGDFGDVLTKLRQRLEDFVVETGIINPLMNGLFGTQDPTLKDFAMSKGPLADVVGASNGMLGTLFGQFGSFLGMGASNGGQGTASVVMNIQTPDANSFRASQGQILASLGSAVARAQGRYG